jgi:RNA polymerase sigma factor (sigma-70 family)
MQEYSDKDIVKLFKNAENREKAFGLIVTKYKERLYWHIRKILISHEDSDDVLQNTFIKVWSKLGDFREESELFTWMYRIATNEALGFLRKSKRRLSLNDYKEGQGITENLSSQEIYSADQIQMKLQEAIEKLPEKQKLVFNMRYYDEIPYEKMSDILKTSSGALKASYHLAVKKIEKYLEID